MRRIIKFKSIQNTHEHEGLEESSQRVEIRTHEDGEVVVKLLAHGHKYINSDNFTKPMNDDYIFVTDVNNIVIPNHSHNNSELGGGININE